MHLRVVGGRRLSGSIDVKEARCGADARRTAVRDAPGNEGRTVLRRVARIEVYRLLEVLGSIGIRTHWVDDGVDLRDGAEAAGHGGDQRRGRGPPDAVDA